MFYDVKKRPLKIRRKHFPKIRQVILKKCHSPMEKGQRIFNIISGTGGKFCTKWQCSIILLHKLKLRIFYDPLKKKRCSPMEKGPIEVSITSLEPWVNSEPYCNVQLFFHINWNCVFSKTIWENAVAQWRKDWFFQ